MMKRLFLLILLLPVTFCHAQIKDSILKAKSVILPKYSLNISYGFPDLLSIAVDSKVNFPSYNVKSLGPLSARLDF
ncbi:MAG TPA: hypothetical protein VF411_14450 [Bacteroidia bacterium]